MTDTQQQPQATAVPPQLAPKIPNGISLPAHLPTVEFTPKQAMAWLEQFFHAMHKNSRLPVDVEPTRNQDGSLTVQVTPHAE
jgi:hypothetical protein